MALGNQNNNNNTLLILKVKTQDAEKKPVSPYFSVLKKDGDDWKEVEKVKDVSGNLTKVETEKKEWEGQEYDVIKVYLEDAEKQEAYLLDLRQNLLARSIFNSLLGLKDYTNVSIGLYESTKEGKTYPTVSVKQNGERASWKFKIDELPKIKRVKVGKKEVVDSAELDDFFIKELEKLSESLKTNKPAAPKTVTVQDENGNDQDIPF